MTVEDRSPPVTELARAFGVGTIESTEALGAGHIHQTFLARCGTDAFVFQRLNAGVFPALDTLLENAQRITEHLRRRLTAEGVDDLDRRVLRLIRTPDGALSHQDASGAIWRCSPYIDDSTTRDSPLGPGDARTAAAAFGQFAVALDDLAPVPAVTLEGFHDLPSRRARLEAAVANDAANRASAVEREVAETLALCDRILSMHDLSELPTRVVHNDCKLNNLLFDATTGEALCVLDLDTVMEGSLVYDFGELVRTACCDADEDEPDLSKIRVDPELLRALAVGYAAGTEPILTEGERKALPLAGARLALENSLRFLTDHLSGDVYFGVSRPEQNLDRQRAQRFLAERLLEQTAVVEDQLRR